VPARLRPLNVGEAFDVGVALFRARFRAMVATAAVAVVPYATLVVLAVSSILPSRNPDTPSPNDGTVGATVALLIVTLLMTAPVVNALCAQLVASRYLDGVDIGVGTGLRAAARHGGAVLLLAVVVALSVALGGLACVVPGALLWVWWSLAAPSIVLEGLGPWAALRRGTRLVRGRYWRTFATLLGAFAVMIGTTVLMVYATLLLSLSMAVGEFAAVLLSAVATAVVLLAWEPLVAAVTVVLYIDARVRHEGFDITWATTLLDRGIDRAPTGTPQPARAVGAFVADQSAVAGPVVARPWGSPEGPR
jgi:hypothetical protein